MPHPDEPQLRARTVRRAMLRPERYLAAAIGADPVKVWQLRLCGWPQASVWADDVRRMADLVDGDPRLLERVLASVGVRRGEDGELSRGRYQGLGLC